MDKDYKKLYEEALERARDLHDNHPLGQPQTWSTCEKIFPELKESEDERVRKGLIKGLSAMRDIHKHQTFSDDAINIDDAIAWLEKQDEKTAEWNEEDEANMDAVWKACGQVYGVKYQSILGDWLKSLKPNHWKPNNEQLNAFEYFVRGICESGYASPYNNNTKLIYSLLNELKNL